MVLNIVREKNKMITKLKTTLFIISCFVFSSYVNAAIYKWVDENGVTHFGNQPPAQKELNEVKEKSGNNFKAHREPRTQTKTYRSQSEKQKDQQNDDHVDCYAAVDNTKSSFKSLREVAREKYKRSNMSYDKYKKGMENLKKAGRSATLSDCEKSKGKKRKFYQCMNRGSGDGYEAVGCALLLNFK